MKRHEKYLNEKFVVVLIVTCYSEVEVALVVIVLEVEEEVVVVVVVMKVLVVEWTK
jgi:hypothetical protein